jgi:hypothetical protein
MNLVDILEWQKEYERGGELPGNVMEELFAKTIRHDDLAQSLANVLRILEAVKYTVGLGKLQLDRMADARAVLDRTNGS